MPFINQIQNILTDNERDVNEEMNYQHHTKEDQLYEASIGQYLEFRNDKADKNKIHNNLFNI